MTVTAAKPYLTVREVAEALDMTPDGVYKLIGRGKLKAIRKSERKMLVSRLALEAYQRRINGQAPAIVTPEPPRELPELLAEFEGDTGMTPAQWLEAWKRDEIEDTAENMRTMVHAAALRALERDATAEAEPGERARCAPGRHEPALRGHGTGNVPQHT